MNVSTLRPGLLVSLKTKVSGNVSYKREDTDPEHATDDGGSEATWVTTKRVADSIEHEEAIKTRNKCRAFITSVCARSDFGLLCPEAKGAELDRAITSARELADDFNRNALLTSIEVYILTGRIEPNDAEAIRSINAEVVGLLDAMNAGVQALDPEAIREAATRAKGLGLMLEPGASKNLGEAVQAARKAARAIVKAAEPTAVAIDNALVRIILDARRGFLNGGPAP